MSPQESMINGYNAAKQYARYGLAIGGGIAVLGAGLISPGKANAIPVPVNPATYTPKAGETPVNFADPTVLSALDEMNNDPVRTTPWVGDTDGYNAASSCESDATLLGYDSYNKPVVKYIDGKLVANVDTTLGANCDIMGQQTHNIVVEIKRPGKKTVTVGEPTKITHGLANVLRDNYIEPTNEAGKRNRENIVLDVGAKTLNSKKLKGGKVVIRSTRTWNPDKNQTFESVFSVNPATGQDEYTKGYPNDGRYLMDYYKKSSSTTRSKAKPLKTVVASIKKSAKR